MKVITNTFDVDSTQAKIIGLSVPQKVAVVTGIDATSVAVTPLFTVPAGKTFVLRTVVFHLTSYTDGGRTTFAIIDIGGNDPDYNDWQTNNIGCNTVGQFFTADSGSQVAPIYAEGTEIKLSVSVGSDATEEVYDVDVFGYFMEEAIAGEPSPTGIVKLATIDNIDAVTGPLTTVYTVPAGKTMMMMKVGLRVTAMTYGSKTTQAIFQFGDNDPDYDNWGSNEFSSSQLRDGYFCTPTGTMQYEPGAVIKMKFTTLSNADVEVWSADLFGYFI